MNINFEILKFSSIYSVYTTIFTNLWVTWFSRIVLKHTITLSELFWLSISYYLFYILAFLVFPNVIYYLDIFINKLLKTVWLYNALALLHFLNKNKIKEYFFWVWFFLMYQSLEFNIDKITPKPLLIILIIISFSIFRLCLLTLVTLNQFLLDKRVLSMKQNPGISRYFFHSTPVLNYPVPDPPPAGLTTEVLTAVVGGATATGVAATYGTASDVRSTAQETHKAIVERMNEGQKLCDQRIAKNQEVILENNKFIEENARYSNVIASAETDSTQVVIAMKQEQNLKLLQENSLYNKSKEQLCDDRKLSTGLMEQVQQANPVELTLGEFIGGPTTVQAQLAALNSAINHDVDNINGVVNGGDNLEDLMERKGLDPEDGLFKSAQLGYQSAQTQIQESAQYQEQLSNNLQQASINNDFAVATPVETEFFVFQIIKGFLF